MRHWTWHATTSLKYLNYLLNHAVNTSHWGRCFNTPRVDPNPSRVDPNPSHVYSDVTCLFRRYMYIQTLHVTSLRRNMIYGVISLGMVFQHTAWWSQRITCWTEPITCIFKRYVFIQTLRVYSDVTCNVSTSKYDLRGDIIGDGVDPEGITCL